MNDSTALRSTSEIGAATRAELIAAGRRLFARRGFDGTSIRAITTEAGANLGAVTYHFGSKQALYEAVLEEGLSPIARRVTDAAKSDGDALTRMLRVVDAYFEHLAVHPDLPHLLLQEVAAGKQPPSVVTETIATIKGALVELHAEGLADGSLRPGHPLLTALSVVSQPMYLALIAPLVKVVGELDLADPTVREMTVAHVRDFVRAGLEPRPEASA